MTKKKFELFDFVNYILLIFFGFVTLFPIIYVLAGSFDEGMDYIRGGIYFFPREITLSNYMVVFNDSRLITGYKITVLRTIIGTITSVLFTSMVAYALSRKYLLNREIYFWIFLFTMFFGGGLIPYFILLKTIGLTNTFWVYIIPYLLSVFNMIIFQNFFAEIPEELLEAAKIDGASEFRIYRTIILPLSKPVLATIALWNGVFHWNSFFDSMVFTTSPKLSTLQLYLMKLIKESSSVSDIKGRIPAQVMSSTTPETIRLAAIIVSIIPIIMVYPFLQKYFMKGLTLGSLKG